MNRDTAQGLAFVATTALFINGLLVWLGRVPWDLLVVLVASGLCGLAVWWVLTRLFMWLFR